MSHPSFIRHCSGAQALVKACYHGISVPSYSKYLPLSAGVRLVMIFIMSETVSCDDLEGSLTPSVAFLTFLPMLVLAKPGCALTTVKPSSRKSFARISDSACAPCLSGSYCSSSQLVMCDMLCQVNQHMQAHTMLQQMCCCCGTAQSAGSFPRQHAMQPNRLEMHGCTMCFVMVR